MAAPVPARLTARDGRRFGLTLAVGFGAVGLLLAWRGADMAARVCWTIGTLAAAAGLLVPTRLGAVERAWMRFGVALSRVTGPVFFSILFLFVITPAALIRRATRGSPFRRGPAAPTYWQRREPADPDVERRRLERQF